MAAARLAWGPAVRFRSAFRSREASLSPVFAQHHANRSLLSRDVVKQIQQERLTQFLQHVLRHSPWHAARLRQVGVVPGKFTVDDLHNIPTMTKKDLMQNWEQIVTDTSLSLDEAKLSLLDTYAPPSDMDSSVRGCRVHATGGSSGLRAVIPWWPEGTAEFAGVFGRFQVLHDSALYADGGVRCAVITSNHRVHMSAPLFTLPLRHSDSVWHIPAALEGRMLVELLNEVKPTHITGFTTSVVRAAAAAADGGLAFTPSYVAVNSEQLTESGRAIMRRAWPNAVIANQWGSTEAGPHAQSCAHSTEQRLHVNEDVVIVEPLDHRGRACGPQELSHKLVVTNTLNLLLPVIRYEIDDRVQWSAEESRMCSCGSALRLIDSVHGKLDDDFVYAKNGHSVLLDTTDIKAVLLATPGISQYQVSQTSTGLTVTVPEPLTAVDTLKARLSAVLDQAGLHGSTVQVSCAPLQRHPETGKVRFFIPLRSAENTAEAPT